MPNRPIPRNMRLMRSGNECQESEESQQQRVPGPPAYLSEAARPHWEPVVLEMIAAGLWRPLFERSVAIFCELLVNFLDDPQNFGASRLGQLRLLGGDLGLTPGHIHRSQRSV